MLLHPIGFLKAAAAGVTWTYDLDFKAGDSLPWTLSRGSTATVLDHEGFVRDCLSGEVRRRGHRRVYNFFPSSGTPATQSPTVVVGARYVFFFRDGGGSGSYALTGAATATVAEGEAFSFTASTTTLTCTLSGTPGGSATVQLEETSGLASTAPSEYVDSATTYNAGVSAVQYFSTTNGNSWGGGGSPGPAAITEAAGSAISSSTLKGLLLEPARTNNAKQNTNVGGASPWSDSSTLSITADATQSPDGRSDGNYLEETAVNNNHFSRQTINLTGQNGNPYVNSIYGKEAQRKWTAMQHTGGGGAKGWFDVDSTPALGTMGSGVTGAVKAAANNFARATMQWVVGTGSNSDFYVHVQSADNQNAYLGVVGNGLYAWGAQFEAGRYVTSLIRTVASDVTRAADVVLTGVTMPDDFTLILEFEAEQLAVSTSTRVLAAAGANRYLYLDGATLKLTNGTQTISSTVTIVAGQLHKVAITDDGSSMSIMVDAETPVTDANAWAAASDTLKVGCDASSANQAGMTIGALRWTASVLSTAERQAETT